MDENKQDPVIERGRSTWQKQSALLSKQHVPENHQLFIAKNRSNLETSSTLGTWFHTLDEALDYLVNGFHADDVEFHVVDGLTSAMENLLQETLQLDRCKRNLEQWRAGVSAPPSLETLTLS